MPDFALNLPRYVQAPLAVAYSGGADSTALLLLCAMQFPGQVQAIHIHHGLQAAADDFAAHCEVFCQRLGVTLHVLHVQAAHVAGQSPEDAARKARYTALAGAAAEMNRLNQEKSLENQQKTSQAVANTAQLAIKSVALAQHADDQVETLLLALSRGAGLPGLASMPAQFERHGCMFIRPLLHASAQDIRAWLSQQALAARHPGSACLGQGWVEDPTNTDEKFTRNRIRQALLPALESAFPQFRQTFARSIRHIAQAEVLLAQAAAKDVAKTGEPPRLANLQVLGQERQANALRYWLKTAHGVAPSAAQLAELQRQIAHCSHRGKNIRIKVASGFVLRLGDTLDFVPLNPAHLA